MPYPDQFQIAELTYKTADDTFFAGFQWLSDIETARYLKGLYRGNFERFKARFLEPIKEYASMALNSTKRDARLDIIAKYFKLVKPYSYREAFDIEKDELRALVFGTINITEMINELGATRVKVEGITLKNEVYNEITGETEIKDLTSVYELWHVNGSKLGLEGDSCS